MIEGCDRLVESTLGAENHPEIRQRLKACFKAILVDEFQDTDPVQYEILLFLAERPEASAARMTPGTASAAQS